MIQIGNTIVSFDLFDRFFLCDLMACKGACCVEGDSGAPLTVDEAQTIEANYQHYQPYLIEAYQQTIAEQGYAVSDEDGDLVTPLFNHRECAYTFKDEHGITRCAIEKAFLEGKTNFRKPLSCHLFPVRITSYTEFDAVNYQQLDICKDGRACGKAQELPLYRFLKEPLIRKYGAEWYKELEIAAEHLKHTPH
ncbi:DUF3109 family protein [Roseimarinus sediminis]|jgi:hypothetical protein|uniref:DUF3109 family protein n=1 Tax=Roseimarinus sediminis TaxID=1610899 RepID=UPI003D1DE245